MSFVYRPIVVRRLPDGSKQKRRIRYYWGCYTDATGIKVRKALQLDNGMRVTRKDVALQRLRELESRAEREAAGLLDPFVEKAGTPTSDAISGFTRYLERNGRSASYLRTVNSVLPNWLERISTIGRITQEAIGRVVDERIEAGATASSLNSQLGIVKSFCGWLVKHAQLLRDDPLANMPNVRNLDNGKRRRALTEDEFKSLLNVATPERGLYYLVAVYTGLRVGELKALQWRDVHWEPEPHLQLRAETTKAKRADRIPLHPVLVETLKPRQGEPTDAVLQVPTLKAVLLDFREAELTIVNDRGEVLDRHALRKTFVTWLSKHGVSPQQTQALARHADIKLTMASYTDESLLQLSDAIKKLPT